MLQARSEGRRRGRDALVIPSCSRQAPCELHQRQRITCCLAENARAEDRVQLGCALIEQPGGGRNTQSLEIERREVGILEQRRVAGANGGHQRHWLTLQPASDERQRAHAGVVKPLHVVDDQDHWPRVGGVTHKLVGRKRHAKRVRLKLSAHPERGFDRSALGFGQPFR